MNGLIRSGCWLVALALASGCVTPAATKEASRLQGQNLESLAQSIQSYRSAVADYYVKVGARQRDAYIAQMMGQDLDRIAQDQFDSLGYGSRVGIRFNTSGKVAPVVPDTAANDFVALGTGLADGFRFWGDNFDWWMKLEGLTLEEKRAALDRQLEQLRGDLEKAGGNATRERLLRRSIELLEAQRARPDDELTYVQVAEGLKRQAVELDHKLTHLQAQLGTMRAFHGVIDEYLGVDATIDGAAVGRAVSEAAGTHPDEFPALQELVKGSKKEEGQ